MRCKAFHFKQNDTRNNSKNIYSGLESNETTPTMKLLVPFLKDLFKIVEKIKILVWTYNLIIIKITRISIIFVG